MEHCLRADHQQPTMIHLSCRQYVAEYQDANNWAHIKKEYNPKQNVKRAVSSWE
jgi:hypothetical protein